MKQIIEGSLVFLLFYGDIFTDVFNGVSLLLNGHYIWGVWTIVFILLPNLLVSSSLIIQEGGTTFKDYVEALLYQFYTFKRQVYFS